MIIVYDVTFTINGGYKYSYYIVRLHNNCQVPLPEIFQRGLYDNNPEFQVNVQTSYDIENNHEACVSVVNSNRWNSDYSNSISTGILKRTPLARQALPLVHQGFLEAYLPVRNELMESVVKVVQRQLSKSILRQANSSTSDNNQPPLILPKIYISGHSLVCVYI